MATPTTENPPHPLTDLLITVVAPSLILEHLSKPALLGPVLALLAAVALPVGFGIYCWRRTHGFNFFSSFGLAAVIITGGLGLLSLDAFWFAMKEGAFPVLLGLAFPLSLKAGRPLVSELLLNPQFINHEALNAALDTEQRRKAFQRLLALSSWALAATMLLSALANTLLVLHYLRGTVPGSEEYMRAIGRQNWVGVVMVGIPMLGATVALLFWMLGRIQGLTGLQREDLMGTGRTVRRTIG
jgi:hypothetical protein